MQIFFFKFVSVIEHNCLSGAITHSSSQFLHSPAGTELLVLIKDLSFNKNIFSSWHSIEREF